MFNFLLGTSFIYWSMAGIWSYADWNTIPPVRVMVSALNFIIGVLIIFRHKSKEETSLQFLLVALPSLLCGGILFKLSKPFELWESYLNVLFVLGCLLTIWSFFFLGRNFSILPYTRNIVSNGPYKFTRHPAYLGETIMILSCLITSRFFLISLVVFILFIPSLVWRILAEEQLLSKQIAYQVYTTQVRWRLIPRIW